MVVVFGVGLGSCLVRFLHSDHFISDIDQYTCHEVFGSIKVYCIHRIMAHRACSDFATCGM